MLADKHSNAYSRHVESVEEGLDIRVDLHPLTFSLVFIDTLRNGCHHAIMPPLDTFQSLGKSLVVVVQFWWPLALLVYAGIVPSGGAFACTIITIAIRLLRSVLAFFYAGVVCSLA